MEELEQTDYAALVGEIKSRIRDAQYQALRAVNKELIDLYWNIGKLIVERQQGETWGQSIVEQLAGDIQQEFPGIQGFSARSIRYMREFYLTYHSSQKLPPLVAQIGWSHNRTILDKCKDDLEREFYIRMTKAHGWTKNVLIHQIENQTYQKTLMSQTNFAKTLPAPMQSQLALAMRHSKPALEVPVFDGSGRFGAENRGIHAGRKPIGVAAYQMVSALPAEYAGQLPTPEQIAGLLGETPSFLETETQ